MRSICLFLVQEAEYFSSVMTPFSGTRFGFSMKMGREVDVFGYEPVVSLCAFMGCRVFGWDKNCYFADMYSFAKGMFPHVAFTYKDGGELTVYISDSTVMNLSMGKGFYYDWVTDMVFTSVGGQVVEIYAHDFLVFSLPAVVMKGRLTFDVRGVSDSLNTRFYSSLRRCVMKASEGGHYSFEGFKGMFYGGERLVIRACMYHFVRMVPGNIMERTLSSASRLFKEYPFWRDFVLYLGDDFYNYLPRGCRGKYEGIVDIARKV